jgi:hypothetical protein
MNKIGLASVAAVVLSGSAMAGSVDRDALFANVIDGGNATMIGTFSRAQLDAMRGVANKDTALYSSNWNSDSNGASYTVGNISTGVGGIQGQGGWYTYSSGTTGNNTAVSNYKIAAGRPGGQTGQGLQITGSNTSTGSRFMYQDLSAQWAARNAGDDIFWAEYSQFCASASSASGNRAGSAVYNTTASKFLCGMAVEMGTSGTNTSQRSVFGYANYLNGSTTGNFRFKLSDQTLSDGSISPKALSGGWTYFATSFNKTTGEVLFYYSIDGGANYTGFFVAGAAAGENVLEFDYYTTTTSGSTTGVTVNYGDLNIYATPAPGAAALVGLAGLMARRRRA